MYKLSCTDLGAADCSHVSVGATAEEAINDMMEHAAMEHPEKMAEMAEMPEDDVMAMMMKHVIETDDVAGDMAS